jgi:hypothetical protein
MHDASPRFRQDLEASTTEAEGVACVDVRDPKAGTNFRFYDFEYQLALQFTGQPVGAVIAWASETYGVDLTVEGVNEFAGRLSELGFLEPPDGAVGSGDLTPARGTVAADGLDSAEEEWMSAEGAKTASFVPDPGMLESRADLTPVAPELPTLDAGTDEEAEAAPRDTSRDEPTPAPDGARPAGTAAPAPPLRLFDIPSPTVDDVPTAPAMPAVKAFAPGGVTPPRPASKWAADLEGKLDTDAATPDPTARTPGPGPETPPPVVAPAGAEALTPPPLPRPLAGPPPSPLATAAATPPGLPERRQPPALDAVQMAAFDADAAAKAKSKRAGPVIAIVLLLIVAAGVAYVFINRERARIPQAAARVRVFAPKPAAVYRWYSGRGAVTDHEARTLAFETAGTLGELLPAGTSFGAGDILGRLRAAQPIEALLARQRARLAFYEQMRDSMRKANNLPELRQAEIKLADKQKMIDEGNANLAKLVVRASEPGEVVETLVKVGTPVAARAPLLRVKGRMLHGEFALDGEDIARASRLPFCRVEVVGLGPRASNAEPPAAAGTAADVGSPEAQAAPRFVDCTIEKPGAAADKLRVTLPDNLGLVPGQPLRLARARFDAVFPVPTGAIAGAEDHRSLWVATAAGTAELREGAAIAVER